MVPAISEVSPVVLLGVLLILVAIAAAAWLVVGSQSLTTPIDLPTPGMHVSMTPLAILIAGAAAMLLFWLGLALIRGSVRRRRRPAKEAKEAQRQAEFEENIRADERTRAEETHQGALAERDRVHDEELQSRLSERDRMHDEDLRSKLADRDRSHEDDYRARQSEDEARIRADERAKVEHEHQARYAGGSRPEDADQSGVSPAGAGAMGGATGAVTGQEAGGGSWPEDTVFDQDRPAPDAGAEGERRYDEDVDGQDSRDGAEGERRYDEDVDDQSREDGTTDEQRHGDRFRTVADKIMGRGPTGEA